LEATTLLNYAYAIIIAVLGILALSYRRRGSIAETGRIEAENRGKHLERQIAETQRDQNKDTVFGELVKTLAKGLDQQERSLDNQTAIIREMQEFSQAMRNLYVQEEARVKSLTEVTAVDKAAREAHVRALESLTSGFQGSILDASTQTRTLLIDHFDAKIAATRHDFVESIEQVNSHIDEILQRLDKIAEQSAADNNKLCTDLKQAVTELRTEIVQLNQTKVEVDPDPTPAPGLPATNSPVIQ